VQRFALIQLVLCKPQDAREDEVIENNCLIHNGREMLVATLDGGDHFAIIAVKDNNEGDDFWVLINLLNC
jgi:hypothetical protein